MNLHLQWSPLVPLWLMSLLLAIAAMVLIAAWRKKTHDFYARTIYIFVLAAVLLNPVAVQEMREILPQKLAVVMDESPSQNIAARDAAAEKVLEHLKKIFPEKEPVVLRAGQDPVSRKNQNTSIFTVLRNNISALPLQQLAGVVLVTDGQVHDVPEKLAALEKLGPINVVLTGKKDEFDRKVTIVQAPKYGLLDETITINLRVDEQGESASKSVVLVAKQDGKEVSTESVMIGQEQLYTFKLDHAGQNVFEFSVPTEKSELTALNNTAAAVVNGVRDRLRVLLVSGVPHRGERAWRDLLKSDPAIDLVHFNILRSPYSFDATPQNEMALIPFPVEELFVNKIRKFDLIIFDKFTQYNLLQPEYLLNVASFVKAGGAFLMEMGSDDADMGMYETGLADILPITPKPPEQTVLRAEYVPQVTETGRQHPVTVDLPAERPWGRWVSQVDVNVTKGQVLLKGIADSPLLILDHAGEGRVAVLNSDNIWMWSKGIDGGGPYTQLLRNTAHWLMREPELEEDYMKAEVKGNMITLSARDIVKDGKKIIMTRPDGKEEDVSLLPQKKGWGSSQILADQGGIYRFSNGSKTAIAIVGAASSEEFSDVLTTAEKLMPIVRASKGKVIWYAEEPDFAASRLNLKSESAYNVTGVKSAPLLPRWLAVLIIFGGLVYVWRRESVTK